MDEEHGFIAIVCGGRLGVHRVEGACHPDSFGTSLVHWLHTADIPALRVLAGAMLLINRTVPSSEELELHARWMGGWVLERVGDQMMTWLEVMAGISATATPADGWHSPDAGVASRSSQVEYGYLLDFDANLFELYRGGQSARSYGRFAKVEDDFPARRIAAWPLASLPPVEVESHWWHWAGEGVCPSPVPCWLPKGLHYQPDIATVTHALSSAHADWAIAYAALDADGEAAGGTPKYDQTKDDHGRNMLDNVEHWFTLLTAAAETSEG